ncbi:hypothetical protein SERLA73DRAFT_114911 [Serpula lacrymans var. lacrymans S7.3]|uniref:Fungal pheromone STE3G-protein-coupled receptor n=2 Tax=Serpula lacrymans var. lacrymans TaxID=341189 RepID=F8QBM1_SERL3|nr:uncharacterized protein SERLADRAFT_363843 [Serpula lacrymans var. lacrymans S7.9]EGN94607.1 hypothetical protein SERLA73DRAFT_114911 [Serpula lacrymans var. lacrymans S7.3]EGO20085.1 hypothetical protein SERLADRAFT_363843 [Serpula lacrymans var. lacrymans S7.9]
MAHPNQASNRVYSAFALLGVILLITQLPYHLRAERTGTCLFIVWLSLSMLNSSINSIIWSNNTVNLAPGWCDISSYVIVASKYGVQLAPLCIARQLYHITTMKTVGRSRFETRRDMFTDLFIGIGLPLLLLPLYYVIQGNRSMIVEQVGCYFVAIRTPPAFLLFAMWPPIFAFVSAVYSTFTFCGTIRRKSHMREVMKSNEDLSSGKYYRLMVLFGAQIVLILPSVIFAFVNDVAGGTTVPYSWDYIHAGFSEVSQVSISAWTSNLQNAIAFQWDRWTIVIYALLFFAFFGLSGEASQYYGSIFHVAIKLFGCRPSTPNSDILRAGCDAHITDLTSFY